jgi:capsular polysaccharide transport system permease protein
MPNNENKPRIMRRPEPANQGQPAANPSPRPTVRRAAPANEQAASAQQADPNLSVRQEIDLIKKENLTGRDLRIARRVAQKHGFQVTSDLDAVRLLRKNGIDPFQTSTNMLKNAANADTPAPMANLPATVRRTEITEQQRPIDNNQRMLDVNKIQKDLVKRRRKRIAAMITKMICFVLIPSMLAGYYFYRVATPMYASFTEFVIQKADNPSLPGAGAGGFLSSSLLATAQDSIAVQGYLSSRDAMGRLDDDLGFKHIFQGDGVDALQRLDNTVTNETAYKTYKKRVQIGFDPTEGIIKMEVVTPSPEMSYEFSRALIGYAEQKVDQLTQRLREDQMRGARDSYEKAETNFTAAQDRVVELQEKLGVLSPESEIAAQMALIQQLETDLQQRELEMIELKDNLRPNKTKLKVLESSIKSREGMIEKLRGQLTQGTDATTSLAKVTAELQSAQSQLILRQELLSGSLLQLETARVEANRQTRYLSMAVAPVAPDEASYPKSFENTLLATLLFAGLFLMVSLTASILREQLTS